MRRINPAVLTAATLALAGCATGPYQHHYDVQLRNGLDRPVRVEVLGVEQGGANRIRADLAPGGEYSGRLTGYGPGYLEARARLLDDPDKDRFYLFELPAGSVRRELRMQDGRLTLQRWATDPGAP